MTSVSLFWSVDDLLTGYIALIRFVAYFLRYILFKLLIFGFILFLEYDLYYLNVVVFLDRKSYPPINAYIKRTQALLFFLQEKYNPCLLTRHRRYVFLGFKGKK